jgi:hypothetical protein
MRRFQPTRALNSTDIPLKERVASARYDPID